MEAKKVCKLGGASMGEGNVNIHAFCDKRERFKFVRNMYALSTVARM